KKKKKKKKAKAPAVEGEPAAAAPASPAVSVAQAEEDTGLDKKFVSDAKEKPTKRYFRFEFKQHPAIRMGKWFRMNFRLKFMHDFRTFDPEIATDEGELANLREFRVGIEGYVTKSFEYRIEREIRDDIAELFDVRDRRTLALWRDVFVNWRRFRKAQV